MATRLYITDPSNALVARFTGTTEALVACVVALTASVEAQAATLPFREAEALHEAFHVSLSDEARRVKYFFTFGFGRFMTQAVTRYGYEYWAGSTTDPAEIRGIIAESGIGPALYNAGVTPEEIPGLHWS
jgi:hypothetical protein